MTGLVIYTALLAQETEPVRNLLTKNKVSAFIYEHTTQPILEFLGLHNTPAVTSLTNKSALSFIGLALLYAVIVWFGMVLPDIDSKNSKLGRYVPFIENTVGHRTVFHSVLPIGILAGLTFISQGLTQQLLLVLTFCYWLHVYEDSWSKDRINWFIVPISRKFKKFVYTVDGPFEKAVYFISKILVLINLVIITWNYIAPFMKF